MKEHYSLYYLILFILFPYYSYSQNFQVKNALHDGIEGVFIQNESGESTVSNKNGEFILMSNGNTFTFSHVNFKTITLSRNYLINNPTIFLDEKVVSLDEIVVGANKWEEKEYENPQQILSIKSEDIENSLPRTTADLISNTGEIFVQSSQMGGGSPMIRGFAANQILLVVDGVRMNNAIYRNGNLQNILSIDPNNIESAEVIFGPGSVIYGSDALGGVMDFHTRTPHFSDEKSLHGDASLRFSTATGEGMGSFHLNYETKRISWIGSATYSSYQDLIAGGWYSKEEDKFGQRKFFVSTENEKDIIHSNFENLEIQKYSGYQQFSTQQKLRYKINNKLELLYSFQFTNTSNIPRYDRLTELNAIEDNNGKTIDVTSEDILSIFNNNLITEYGNTTPKFSEWYYGPQYWMLNSLKWSWSSKTQLFDNFKAIIAYQKVKEDRHNRKFESEKRLNDFVGVNVWSLNIDLIKEVNSKFDIAYGLEGTINTVNSKAHYYHINTGRVEATLPRYAGGGSNYATLGGYGLGRYHFNSSLTASLGMRYSHTYIQADYTDVVSQNLQLPYDHFYYDVGSLTGSLGLAYHTKKWQLSTQFAKGFKAPNIDDIAKVYNPSKDNLVVPNTNLKPTDVYTLDTKVERKIGENMLFSMVGFYSWLQNAMVRGPYQYQGQDSIVIEKEKYAVFALQNTGKAEIYGYTINVKTAISQHFSVVGTFTQTYGEDLVNKENLRHIPPAFGKISINYATSRLHLGLNSMFSGGIPFNELAPSEREKPYLYSHSGALPWWILNFQSNFRLQDFAEIHFNISNIFDKSYRTYSSGINASGRNISIGLKGFF